MTLINNLIKPYPPEKETPAGAKPARPQPVAGALSWVWVMPLFALIGTQRVRHPEFGKYGSGTTHGCQSVSKPIDTIHHYFFMRAPPITTMR